MPIDTRVFPTSGRQSSDVSVDLGTNLVTEHNVASILSTVCDNTGFVLTDENLSGDVIFTPGHDLDFVIKGYQFHLEGFDPEASPLVTSYVKLTLSSDTLTAGIFIKRDANHITSYDHLVPLTAGGDWGDEGSTPTHSLTLMVKRSNTWYIPNASRKILKGYSLDLDEGVF